MYDIFSPEISKNKIIFRFVQRIEQDLMHYKYKESVRDSRLYRIQLRVGNFTFGLEYINDIENQSLIA